MGVDPQKLQSAMDSVVLDVKNNLISEKEFQKIQNQVETDFVTGNSTVAGIAESLANYEVYFGNANLINTELERYKK